MDVLVVGAGAMGRWIGRALQSDADEEIALSFADADVGAAEDAAAALDGTVVSEPKGATPDVVIVAVPIPAAADAIQTWGPRARTAVVDVTGTMRDPIEAMKAHALEREQMSLHPLFAPENEPGNVAVVTERDGPAAATIRDALASRGNTLYETTRTEHDEAMETVQASAHAAILAFALTAESVPEELHTPVSADLSAIADQVTSGEARVYADIQAAFDGADDVATAARRIADADGQAFTALYEEAGK